MTGKQFRERRKTLGLTQSELAERWGLNNNTLSRWEVENPPCPYPGLLADALATLEREHALAVEPLVEQLGQQIETLQTLRERLAKRSRESAVSTQPEP